MAQGGFTYTDGLLTLSVGQIAAVAEELRSSVQPRGATTLLHPSGLDLAAAVLGLEGHASVVQLVPAATDAPGRFVAARPLPTTWVVYSSGTTGAPKPITHTIDSLSRGVRSDDRPRTWGLLYDPARLAGIAVVLQALRSGSRLVEARVGTIGERVTAMRDAGVNALSATPTLWRQMLQSGRTSGWPLDQVTLGGEASDQRILDALSREFPSAHLTHVFAATETGVAFSVGDGLEGFPREYLDSPPRGTALAVREGVLWVRSPGSAEADSDGFVSTGDAVHITNSRVLFDGRVSGLVNVGGTKVFPEQVERVLLEHRDVGNVVVTARPNALSGQILVARVEPRDTASPRLAAELRKWSAERLPRAMVPAQFTIVEELPSSPSGKVVRS